MAGAMTFGCCLCKTKICQVDDGSLQLLAEKKIGVTSSDHPETNSGEMSEQSGDNHAIPKAGQKEYMYADLRILLYVEKE